MGRKVDVNKMLEEAKRIHNGKYDYSKVEYKNWKQPVIIICPEHGEFKQTLHNHVSGQGCPKCGKINAAKKMSTTKEEFIKKSRAVHGNKYDYSKVEYVNGQTKVCIICPEHGEFWQTPGNHLSGSGCPKCSGKNKKTTLEFISDAVKKHGNKYDYSKVNYTNNHTKICIICPEHGEFWQTPNKHLRGDGCPYCSFNKKLDTVKFIERAKMVHGDKYDYSKIDYLNNRTKVCIICSEHGEFWQTPANHLMGVACPKCAHVLSKLEKEVETILKEQNIGFEAQKKFPWLKRIQPLSLDFYLPEYYIAIECQGEQHFKPVDYFGGMEELNYVKERDEKKRELCEENGVKVLYFSDIQYSENVINNKEELLKKIKNEGDLPMRG